MPRPSHRETILQSGLAVFHEFGYHASGVQTVVDHAGVPKGSFYNHFKSKDELGLEVLNVYWQQYEEARSALRNPEQSPLDRIDKHLEAFSKSKFGCLVGNFTSEMANATAFQEPLREMFDDWISDVESCIAEGQKDGSIRNDEHAKVLAEFLVTALEGAILKRKIEDNDHNIVNFRKTMILFLRTI